MGIRLNGQTTGYVQIEAPATAADNTLKLPNGNGSNGQMLTTDGNGNLAFTTPASTELINDPTPQLGGDLNVDGNSIVSANNGDIVIDPNGTGKISVDGNITSSATSIQVEKDLNFGSTKRVVGLADPASAQDAATKSYVDTNANLAADSSPQLGGNLDVNGHDIVTVSNGDIDLDPNGSGQVVFKGNSTRGSGAVKLNCEFNSHGIVVQGPPHSAGANYTLTLPNDTGTSGQLLSTNGSGVTSWTNVEASPTYQATASGAIANGDTCIVKSDGNVAAVSKTVTAKTVANFDIISTSDNPEASSFSFRSCYADNEKAVVATYRKDSGDTQCARAYFVGNNQYGNLAATFSNELTLGGSVKEFSTLVYDSTNNRVVFFFLNSSNELGARVATVPSAASTSFSLGSTVTVDTAVQEENFDCSFDVNAGKIVVVYRGSSDTRPHIAVGTVDPSNNSISFGTIVNAVSTIGKHNSIVYDANAQKHVHVYTNSSNDFEAKVFTVSGTSGSYGSATTITTSNPHSTKGVFDSAQNKVCFAFRDDSIGDAGKVVAGNVSGTSVTFGSVVNIYEDDVTTLDLDFDPDVQKVVIGYAQKITNDLKVTRANISGTTVTVDTPKDTTVSSGTTGIGVTYHKAAEKLLLTNRDPGNGYGSTRIVGMSDVTTNLTATNYIGIADAAYSNGATATIQIIGGVDDAQSGLTPGLQYYVQKDGSLSTGAATPSVVAGTAVSATKLIVKG